MNTDRPDRPVHRVEASHAIDAQLRSAIDGKRLIQLRYHGRPRTVEPHDYGIQKGIERLLVYQLRAPFDRSGESVTGWRLLDVSQIEDCEVLNEGFPGSRGDSYRRHLEWEILYARVASLD
jgi:hypothetical protein